MPIITGAIVIWSGAIIDIPEGWALCDGTNGTLDLQNKFIIGAGDTYNVGDTGGFTDSVLLSHNHSVTINSIGNHSHSVPATSTQVFPSNIVFGFTNGSTSLDSTSISAAGSHSHTININSAGTSATNANLPPYYALAFIQQIE